jgi:hypothetical protein
MRRLFVALGVLVAALGAGFAVLASISASQHDSDGSTLVPGGICRARSGFIGALSREGVDEGADFAALADRREPFCISRGCLEKSSPRMATDEH